MNLTRRKNLLVGFMVLTVCVVWGIDTFNVLPAYLQDIVNRSLPILIVFFGLWHLLRRRLPMGTLIAFVLSVILLAGVIFQAFSLRAERYLEAQQVPIQYNINPAILLVRVRLQTLNTDVEVVRLPEGSPARTISGAFAGSTESNLTVSYLEEADNTATFAFTEVQLNPFPLLETIGRGKLLIELPSDTPVDVQLETLDSPVTLNMTGLRLERLNVKVERGNVILTLPSYDPAFSTAEDGLGTIAALDGDVLIRVPSDVATRFDMSNSNGSNPTFDESLYDLKFNGDLLEARNIFNAPIVQSYALEVNRAKFTLTVP